MDFLLLVVLRVFRVVRYVVPLRAQFLDRGGQLIDRRADVRQLDNVGLRKLRQPTQLREIVGNALRLLQMLRERREKFLSMGSKGLAA